jgi:hypothetical protein
MATYLVLKRVREDWVSLPGELLVDPPTADILLKRGFIVPVPDNYPGAVSKPKELAMDPPPAPDSEAADSPDFASEPTPPVRPVAKATRTHKP